MKVTTIVLNGIEITLRLTASGLVAYAEAIGTAGNSFFAIMDALDDIQKQGRLFTAALTYKDNNNPVTDGLQLIDMMADADWDPVKKKELIVQLAQKSGVVGNVDAARLLAAIRSGTEKLYDTAVAILSGDMSNLENDTQNAEEPAENPT